MFRSRSVAKKAADKGAERRLRAPLGRVRRLASEPVEEIAGRVRVSTPRPANDNEPNHRLLALIGRPVLLASVAAIAGLIAGLLLK
jgi:hypothetical protein